MLTVPTYGKVLSLGAAYTENALCGEVQVQEKIDGSFFGAGVNEAGDYVFRSRGVSPLTAENTPKEFQGAIDYLRETAFPRCRIAPDTYFYAELVGRPKHNVLCYGRPAKHGLVLFDLLEQGRWASRRSLVEWAIDLEIDVVPELCRGHDVTLDRLRALLATPSFLGRETVEGVVIKNYGQTILLGGQVFPLHTKLVRAEYKERHTHEWGDKPRRSNPLDLPAYLQTFCTEARWNKAVAWLRDQGRLQRAPQDIGALIRRVQDDVVEEERATILRDLWSRIEPELRKRAGAGLAEWYKQRLVEETFGERSGALEAAG